MLTSSPEVAELVGVGMWSEGDDPEQGVERGEEDECVPCSPGVVRDRHAGHRAGGRTRVLYLGSEGWKAKAEAGQTGQNSAKVRGFQTCYKLSIVVIHDM